MAIELAKQVCIGISYMNTTDITDFLVEEDLLFQATALGISELTKLCIQFFSELIWIAPCGGRLMAHAVRFRQGRSLGLFLKVSSANELSLVPMPTCSESEWMMEEIAEYKSNLEEVINVSGAAFRMQREVQWFKVSIFFQM